MTVHGFAPEVSPAAVDGGPVYKWRRFAILIAICCAVVWLIPRPAAVQPAGWRLFGLFAAPVAGLILQPVPGGALVLTVVDTAGGVREAPLRVPEPAR